MRKKPLENTVGKVEYAGYKHFLLLPQCFLPVKKTNFQFSVTWFLLSANAFDFDKPKILSFGNELNIQTKRIAVIFLSLLIFSTFIGFFFLYHYQSGTGPP